jgi:hypothetical protein
LLGIQIFSFAPVTMLISGAQGRADCPAFSAAYGTSSPSLCTKSQSDPGVGYVGPRSPTLPPSDHSMDVPTFTLSALRMLGFRVSEPQSGVFLAEERGAKEYGTFEEKRTGDRRISLYSSQSPAFQRLVKRVAVSGIHDVKDADANPEADAAEIARQWLAGNGAGMTGHSIASVERSFGGNALLRVRANTAHDSYERLVSCA